MSFLSTTTTKQLRCYFMYNQNDNHYHTIILLLLWYKKKKNLKNGKVINLINKILKNQNNTNNILYNFIFGRYTNIDCRCAFYVDRCAEMIFIIWNLKSITTAIGLYANPFRIEFINMILLFKIKLIFIKKNWWRAWEFSTVGGG